MKKLIYIFLISTFSCIAVYFLYKKYFYKVSGNAKYNSFLEWRVKNQFVLKNFNFSQDDSVIIESPFLLIDTIYRSMEGPTASKTTYLTNNFANQLKAFFKPELIWITGYKVEIFDENGNKISDDFMCHNNLNIASRDVLPWKIKTQGTDKRLFTLTEGQTFLHLPENMGIPVMSDQLLRIDFQVLNHNIPKINLKIKQVATIFFKKDLNCSTDMKPLFQQSIFVTKQLEGPIGMFDTEPQNKLTALNLNNDEIKVCCTKIDTTISSGFPFHDRYHRKFTGHWILPDTTEILSTYINPFLKLKDSAKVYFFSAHVHPFCESLQLFDNTDSTLVYSVNTINFTDKIGLSYISSKGFNEGLKMYNSHYYTLISKYRKTHPAKHTAMATMFLYLEEY